MTTTVPPAAATARSIASPARLSSIDALRGLVMAIMALDHVRDFFSSALFDPTDLTRTTPALFLTRWITHFCAPIFVLLAGTSAYLSIATGNRDQCELPAFLLKRGIWLMFLEVAVIAPLGWAFSFGFGFTRLQVIWAIGASMVVLSGLVFCFPPRFIAALGLFVIAGHNLFDGPHAAWLGNFAGVWQILSNPGFFQPFAHKVVGSLYPVIPWAGVMALGYGAGGLALTDQKRRKRIFLAIGLSMIALFVVIRATNFYGDPHPWPAQRDPLTTLLSFLNCTKYPPSLLYVLMTLGPAMCFLAYADRLPKAVSKVLCVFGRVPLFYYLLHLPLIHALAVLLSYVRYGRADWLFQDSFALRGSAHPLPPGYGYDLWVVYLIWAAVVIALYPLCRWYAAFKRSHRHPLLSYL